MYYNYITYYNYIIIYVHIQRKSDIKKVSNNSLHFKKIDELISLDLRKCKNF